MSELNLIVDDLKNIVVCASADVLALGAAPRPQVHVFDETLDQPYVGYVMCRLYNRGQ